MSWLERKKGKAPVGVVQTRRSGGAPFGGLGGYVPLGQGEMALYRAIRENVPILDAAVVKLVRLCGGVKVICTPEGQDGLNRFLERVPTGWGQEGLQSFLDRYLDSMLVCGRAVGEIVLDPSCQEIVGLLSGRVEDIEIREGEHPLDCVLCLRDGVGQAKPLPWQDLLLFTPYQPESGHPYGVSLLRSTPALAQTLIKIYDATERNWERMGNPRFAVLCKDSGDGVAVRERCEQVAREWSRSMERRGDGSVCDFVAAGELDIKVIGADGQVLDSQATVRQILEQLVAKTGLPPFLLGLSWSSTERMSSQQADMLTSEITAIRRSLTPVVAKICRVWLRLHGLDDEVRVEWEDINLQDMVEEAHAELYRAQAKALEN